MRVLVVQCSAVCWIQKACVCVVTFNFFTVVAASPAVFAASSSFVVAAVRCRFEQPKPKREKSECGRDTTEARALFSCVGWELQLRWKWMVCPVYLSGAILAYLCTDRPRI